MTKFEPITDKILVKIVEAEKKTASGLYVPDATKGKVLYGVVLAKGPDESIKLEVGDKVVFDESLGTRAVVTDDAGDHQRIIRFVDLLAVVR